MTSRRLLLTMVGLPWLQACAAPFQKLTASATTPEAAALLAASADAHGSAALPAIGDVSVRYAGQWRGLVGALQPALVDEGFRGGSEERLLLRGGLSAQAYTGPRGVKFTARQDAGGEGTVRVWFNGSESLDEEKRQAAALVADGYRLFLLGPMLFHAPWAGRALTLQLGAPQTITAGGAEIACDTLRGRITPGIGLSTGDDLALFIGKRDRLMRRVRFSLNGLPATQGAVAEVDCSGHTALAGVQWPTRFHEQLLRPLPLPVHDWRLEGLDVNRGLAAADLDGPVLAGKAAPPATALAGAAAASG